MHCSVAGAARSSPSSLPRHQMIVARRALGEFPTVPLSKRADHWLGTTANRGDCSWH